MAYAIQGLKVHRQYEDLIGVAVSDKLSNIKFPNRNATFLRNGFVLSQLDGEGMRQMEKQQEMASKESYKEHLLKEIAKNTGSNIHDLRNDNHDDMRKDRIEKAVHFDISQDDDDDVVMTDSTEVKSGLGGFRRDCLDLLARHVPVQAKDAFGVIDPPCLEAAALGVLAVGSDRFERCPQSAVPAVVVAG